MSHGKPRAQPRSEGRRLGAGGPGQALAVSLIGLLFNTCVPMQSVGPAGFRQFR